MLFTVNEKGLGSSPSLSAIRLHNSVGLEYGSHKPEVTGSSPVVATLKI